MPLKLKRPKGKAAKPDATPVPVENPKSGVIVTEPDMPRSIHLYGLFWSEVFSTKDDSQIAEAKKLIQKNLVVASTVVRIDPDTSESVLFTTPPFTSEIRHLLNDHGLKPWGVE